MKKRFRPIKTLSAFFLLGALLLLQAGVLRAMDVNALGENQWVNIENNVPNYGNGAYENDLQSDPLYGLVWVGPGHRGTSQDDWWYVYDPQASARGVPEWTNPDAPSRPAKKCLPSFSFSSGERALLSLGGTSVHQASMGVFNADYTRIEDRNALTTSPGYGYDAFAYFLARNRWYYMRSAGPRHPAVGGMLTDHRLRYDPVHDVSITYGGVITARALSETWTYNLHDNTWIRLNTANSPGPRTQYAADVDTRRGEYTLMGGAIDNFGSFIQDMWKLDLEAGDWVRVTTNVPGGQPNYVTSMAYDPLDDAFLYMQGTSGYRLHVYDVPGRVWTESAVPSLHPRDAGRLAFNVRYNVLMLLGGAGTGDGREYDGLWAYRHKIHDLAAVAAQLQAPDASITTVGGTPRIQWTPLPGATYHVYRGDVDPYPKGFVRLTGSPIATPQYADASASAGSRYSYRVSAVVGGVEGEKSRHLYTRPARPLGVVASVENAGRVRVSWEPNEEPDIVGYHVYRARGADMYAEPFSYTRITASPVSGTEITDNPDLADGVARGYIVTAVNAFGLESGYSPVATTFPAMPERVSAKPVPGGSEVRWSPPARTAVSGVRIGTRTEGSLPGGDLVTASPWNTSHRYTLVVRAVNVLGQSGFVSPEIGAEYNDFTEGLPPLQAAFDFSKYGTPWVPPPPPSVSFPARPRRFRAR
jgi:hypothetical protein